MFPVVLWVAGTVVPELEDVEVLLLLLAIAAMVVVVVSKWVLGAAGGQCWEAVRPAL